MKSRIFLSLFALTLGPLTLPGASLIADGSFETPTVAAGSYQSFPTGTTMGAWTVVGAPGDVDLDSGGFTQLGITFPAEDGAQFVDLTGLSNSATGVQQSVTTTSGQVYTLSFWVGNVDDTQNGGLFGVTSTVNVLINGTQSYSATNSSTNNSTLTWQQFSTSFTATSASTTIAFINGDPSTDNMNGLDNVTLTGASNAVPEPASYLTLALGLTVFLLIRRRAVAHSNR